MTDNNYSKRAWLEFCAYQSLAAYLSIFSAAALPLAEKKWLRMNEGFTDYLGLVPRVEPNKCLWVHGVSMGEAMVAEGFAKELKTKFPEMKLVFSSTHPDVIKNVKKRGLADHVIYFPIDSIISMKRAFNRLNPIAVFVAETDFWPVFSFQCRKRQIPLFLINGRISDKLAAFYKKARGLAEIVFSAFSLFMVQSKTDLQKLVEIGVSPVKVKILGNIKADLTMVNNEVDLSCIKNWLKGRKLVIFGSLHPSEFKLFKKTFADLVQREVAVLIAPRNLKKCNQWLGELKEQGLKAVLKSRIKDEESEVMLLDTMGELASVYALADVAFVGGSIDPNVGGHNPLEVIQQNVPLFMGTNNRNFADIIEQLQNAKAVYLNDNPESILEKGIECLSDKNLAAKMKKNASMVLEKNKGAMTRTIKEVATVIDKALNRSKK
ncbi:MAG: 3-deoxy-D-manno-octulosonic acid transferase [Candidatus Rifleibacteriota bacterium]